MSIKDDVIEIQKELQEAKQESLALEMLKDQRTYNKRMFKCWLITFIVMSLLLASSIGYIIYLLNDIGTSTETIDIQDVENIDGSNIGIGDGLWAK